MMKSINFPVNFLDQPEICDLAAESKLFLATIACHLRQTPSAVIFLSDFVVASLSLPISTVRHIASELDRSGVGIYSEDTREFFIKKSFYWHKTPGQVGINSPWAKHVYSSVAEVRSPRIRAAVEEAISSAPAEKFNTVQVPSNFLSSLPTPGLGKKWTASELLVMISCFTMPSQNAAGLTVIDVDVLGALCSLQGSTVLKCLATLNFASALYFDAETCEIFLPARLKNASLKFEKKTIDEARLELRSPRLKIIFRKHYFRTFGKNTVKTNCCSSVDSNSVNTSGVNSIINFATGSTGSTVSNGRITAKKNLSITAKLDELRVEGGRTNKYDKERDQRTLQKISDTNAWLGGDVVMAAIGTANYPSQALKACRETGLIDAAERVEKAENEKKAREKREIQFSISTQKLLKDPNLEKAKTLGDKFLLKTKNSRLKKTPYDKRLNEAATVVCQDSCHVT